MAARNRARRGEETKEEQKERLDADKAHKKAYRKEEETKEKRQERLDADKAHKKDRREKELKEALEAMQVNDFDISAEDLIAKMEVFDKHCKADPKSPHNNFFEDSNRNVIKALLLFYLNSGCMRFDQYKEYSAKWDKAPIDMAKLEKEIEEEALSNTELVDLLTKFLKRHSYSKFNLTSCGGCGVRGYEYANLSRQEQEEAGHSG